MWLFFRTVMTLGDVVEGSFMLRGIKRRVERTRAARPVAVCRVERLAT
jgi:hypothetical protein